LAQLSIEEELASFVEMFGSATRIGILKRLQGKRMRMAHLAKEMDIPIQEVHRNALRLMETGLVYKGQDSHLTITDLGVAANIQLESLEFMSMHREYFKNHTLLFLPTRSLYSVSALKPCVLMNGTVSILEKIAEFYDHASFVKAIAPQVPLDHIVKLATKIKASGTRVSYILGQNTVVPLGRKELLSSLGWNDFIRRGLVKRRMADQINIGLIVTDREAGVLFPDMKGTIDSNTMYYGTDKVFLKWCEDLFDELWSAAHDFEESALSES